MRVSVGMVLILGGDSIDEDGQSALPGGQIIRGDTVGTQRVHQKAAKVLKLIISTELIWLILINTPLISLSHLPSAAGDATGGVGVAHVVDVAQQLEFVIHGRDDRVQTVGDQGDLFVELGIASQRINGDFAEFGKVFLDAGSLLEEPFNQIVVI
jgi:hypothetical protein